MLNETHIIHLCDFSNHSYQICIIIIITQKSIIIYKKTFFNGLS